MAKCHNTSGHLSKRGNVWTLVYSVDAVDDEGNIIRRRQRTTVGPASLTKKEARDLADRFLDAIRNLRAPLLTYAEYWERVFFPNHVAKRKHSTQLHHQCMFKEHIRPALGDLRLDQIETRMLQTLVDAKLRAGYSVQTVTHVRNCISGLFHYAIDASEYTRNNPAAGVRLPHMTRVREKHALTIEQAQAVLAEMVTPVREMVLLSITSSMNRAELLALKWARVNLTDRPTIADGENLPPLTLAVRENLYRGVRGTVKCSHRERIVPLPSDVVQGLTALKSREHHTGPDDTVFCNEAGNPLDYRSVERHVFKRVGNKLAMPWLNWHVFRRTFATLADQAKFSPSDVIASMGHARYLQSLDYTAVSIERRRGAVEQLAQSLSETKSKPNGSAETASNLLEGPSDAGADGGRSRARTADLLLVRQFEARNLNKTHVLLGPSDAVLGDFGTEAAPPLRTRFEGVPEPKENQTRTTSAPPLTKHPRGVTARQSADGWLQPRSDSSDHR